LFPDVFKAVVGALQNTIMIVEVQPVQAYGVKPATNMIQRFFSAIKQALTLRRQGINLSWSVILQVPLTPNVTLLFQGAKERIDGAGTKINPEIPANASDYLVSMHGLPLQKLKDHEIQEAPHELDLDLPQLLRHIISLMYFCPTVFPFNSYTICLLHDILQFYMG